jgi:crotonobetainyl-CoA:carnitine CoA-transferase CaiB-like acyl-CoA transferase
VPCGRIYSIDEMFQDPQVQALEMVETAESPYYRPLRLVGQGFRLSRTPSDVRLRPPECGEHTEEILNALGYTLQEIADLRSRGIV